MMMRRLKLVLWIGLSFVAIIAVMLLIQGMARLYSLTQEARTLDTALSFIEPRWREGRLRWLDDAADTARAMEPLTRESIASDYLLAYDELSFSALSGDTSGLSSYFQEAALDDALLLASNPHSTVFADWEHQLELHFYAPDGATVSFTDTYWYAESIHEAVPPRIAIRELDVVMTLDDGNWRIHHWRSIKDEPFRVERQTPIIVPTQNIKGVNYIARSAPFNELWPNFNRVEVDADFATISQLGFNTIRIFLPYPEVEGMENFARMLELANRHNLQVIPTLLDTYTCYCLADLGPVTNYLKRYESLLNHPNVLMIDVKNQADRDFEQAGLDNVRAFLGYVFGILKRDTTKPLTVGLINPDPILAFQADVISFHHYGENAELDERIREAKRYGKPVLLEEFGFHSWRWKLPDPHTELEQAAYYQEVLEMMQAEGIGWLAWTLYDLPSGPVPENRTVERHLGIVKADGQPKKVLEVINGARVEVTLLDTLLKYALWAMAAFLMLLFAGVAAFLAWRYYRQGRLRSLLLDIT